MPISTTSVIARTFFLSIFSLLSIDSQAAVSRELAYPAEGVIQDAEEIARQVYFANHFYAFRNFSIKRRGRTMSVLINRAREGSELATAVERHLNNNYNTDETLQSRDLAIFHSGKMRGTGMLVTEYMDDQKNKDYMVWLPSLRKIRRFSQPKQDDAWGGSVFTFGDVTLRKPEDETHELIGTKPFHTCLGIMTNLEGKHYRYAGKLPERSCRHLNKEVYGLKSTTKFKNWWYDYRISYVDTKSFADYRTLYFKNGELIKIIDRDWGLVNTEEEGDPRALFWKYWYGLDLRTGHESLAVIPKKVVEYNSNRRNSFWTEKTLRKIKR
ncbi:MAG: outer membrane lipoprotein-sorting protein [Candidatus Thiodiazotropha sp. (ex Myrtea spinifera)]|nr:outer membrane lipoprotein-sorting protein [Candidatus Thiodiazotropha sp. (ex Myrtea spinifera)]MCU7829301.1 outer membrane lipoprotein-sorting protein [Candidatus Thiodiazotropha sp. (ex Myrtea sp. 'scaly one' KF741663)]